jgi:tetratricopeptide (TPR) repeat protein
MYQGSLVLIALCLFPVPPTGKSPQAGGLSPDEKRLEDRLKKRAQEQLDTIEESKRVVALSPDSAEAHLKMAEALSNGPQTADSPKQIVEEYLKAIALRPDYAEAYCGLGAAYGNMDEYQRERDAYNKAISLKPKYAEPYLRLGVAYLLEKRYRHAVKVAKTEEDVKLAIGMFRQAISLKSDLADAYAGMGMAYSALKQNNEAMDAFRQATDLNPKDFFSGMALADLYIEMGNKDAAMKQYNAFIQLASGPGQEDGGLDREDYRKAAMAYADMLIKKIQDRFGDK